MSRSKKFFTAIAVAALAPLLIKSAGRLYEQLLSTGNAPDDLPDGMGYTSAGRTDALASQLEKLERSRLEFQDGYYDEILNRCRIQLEFMLTYILKCENHYKFPPRPPAGLHALIFECKKYELLPPGIIDALNNAKSYCNSGSHYNENAVDVHSIFFVMKVTGELLDLWKSGYVQK